VTTPPFAHLLETAYELGLGDGREARLVELPSPVDLARPFCRGRDPEEFAVHLWAGHDGPPPAGLAVSAPRWYALGFAEGRRPASCQSSSASSSAARVAPSVSTGR
jgi:hypothetical protein